MKIKEEKYSTIWLKIKQIWYMVKGKENSGKHIKSAF